jgi:probable HAF family extracellular repeat protein
MKHLFACWIPALTGGLSVAVGAPIYSAIDLGTLGGTYTYARAINNRGEVVGSSEVSPRGTVHAFLYRDGRMADLGDMGGAGSHATGINNLGEVAGFFGIPDPDPDVVVLEHMFLYSGGIMHDLGRIGPYEGYTEEINVPGRSLVGPRPLVPARSSTTAAA